MKRRQTLSLLILSLAMLVTLTGCIVIPQYKQYDIAPEEVSSIEIHYLQERTQYREQSPGAETLAYTLEDAQKADFLSDLSDIRFSDAIIITIAAIDPSFSYGVWTVRINYTDGSYAFLSCDGYGETFDANDSRIEGNHFDCDDDEWEAFIRKYLPQEFFATEETEEPEEAEEPEE